MGDFAVFMAAPFAGCLVIVAIHAYLGLHILKREVIFVDLALAQIAALGTALGLLIGYDLDDGMSYLLSLAATLVAAALFATTRAAQARIPQEATIGIVYIVSAAAAILVLDHAPHGAENLKTLLVGQIVWIDWRGVGHIALIYGVVGALHWFLRERFLTISFREEEARRLGWSLRWWDFAFYASFGFVITISVPIAGILLVFSFLIVPAVCAALLSDRLSLRRRLAISWTVGAAVSLVGCTISFAVDLPTGATIVCTFGAALIVIAVARGLHAI